MRGQKSFHSSISPVERAVIRVLDVQYPAGLGEAVRVQSQHHVDVTVARGEQQRVCGRVQVAVPEGGRERVRRGRGRRE